MRIPLLLLFSILWGQFSWASNGSFYGLGAKSIAQGNAVLTRPIDAYSQFYNPALMAWQPDTLVSTGIQGAITSFKPITSVLTDKPDLGGSANEYTDVSTNTPDTFIGVIALQVPLSKTSKKPIHVGLHFSTPIEHMILMETQDPFLPQYSMYLADSQRVGAMFSLAKGLSEKLAVGLGLDMFLSAAASETARLPSGGNSTSRMKMTAKPGFSPVIGLSYKFSDEWSSALVWRDKKDYRIEMALTNSINILSTPSPLLMSLNGSLYYDPMTVSLGVSRQMERHAFEIGARYEHWETFSGTAIQMNFGNFQSSLSQNLPDSRFHNVINLLAGYEYQASDSDDIRLGYGFLPSPVPHQTGDTNYLDSDRHVLSLGYGKTLTPEFVGGRLSLDAAAFVHLLRTKEIVKVSSDSIGAPGYTIGGTVYGYALTATLEID